MKTTCPLIRLKCGLMMVLALVFVGAPCPGTAAVEGPTPLEVALMKWKQGQNDSAVKEFLRIDWSKTPVFSAGSPLTTREKDLASMSAPTREKLMGMLFS